MSTLCTRRKLNAINNDGTINSYNNVVDKLFQYGDLSTYIIVLQC